jgi:hypothetical protein
MRLLVSLTGLILVFTAAPAGAQTRAPDLPPDLWAPLAPDRASAASSSAGLPLAPALAVLAVVAIVGFLIGDRTPSRATRPPIAECWIALWRSGRTAEFRAVVGEGAGRVIIGRSPAFAAPATGPIPDDGPARAALDELVERLRPLGWVSAGAHGDAWYQLGLEQRRVDGRLPVPA